MDSPADSLQYQSELATFDLASTSALSTSSYHTNTSRWRR